ncbi:hypothetical protein FPV67DRAFT_98729 [Lyophyllum atratum]|nr:hypothetical protein FPV67DRAFT_98729 [Lyophyllum atratum]
MFGLSFLLLCFSLHVLANTEIVNFSVSEDYNTAVAFASKWPRLNNTHNEREWTILPAPLGTPLRQVCGHGSHALKAYGHSCPHELWMVLDLTRDWTTYSSFTLRLSWPASHPADFSIQIHDFETLSAHFGVALQPTQDTTAHKPPQRYARIRAVDRGVLAPTPKSHATDTKPAVSFPLSVPFIVVLEPLYFGVLPASVLPVLAYILLACIASYFAVPKITRHLNGIAAQAKKELENIAKQE